MCHPRTFFHIFSIELLSLIWLVTIPRPSAPHKLDYFVQPAQTDCIKLSSWGLKNWIPPFGKSTAIGLLPTGPHKLNYNHPANAHRTPLGFPRPAGPHHLDSPVQLPCKLDCLVWPAHTHWIAPCGHWIRKAQKPVSGLVSILVAVCDPTNG